MNKKMKLFLFLALPAILISIILISVFFSGLINLGDEAKYELTVEIECEEETSSSQFILIPLSHKGKYSNDSIGDLFRKSENTEVQLINFGDVYFYKFIFFKSSEFRLYDALKEDRIIEKFSKHEKQVKNFLNGIPRLNSSYSPHGNSTNEFIHIFYHSNENSTVNIQIHEHIDEIGWVDVHLNENISVGWNTCEYSSRHTIS